MKKLSINIFKSTLILGLFLSPIVSFGDLQINSYGNDILTENRSIDKGTFNEYRRLIINDYSEIKDYYDINNIMPLDSIIKLSKHVKDSYNYLPETSQNDSLFKNFVTKIEKSKKDLKSSRNKEELFLALGDYLENKIQIKSIAGEIFVKPNTGNAPLNVSLEGNAIDPSGNNINSRDYIWWIRVGNSRKILGTGKNFNYTFQEEGNYNVFLDISSNSRNKYGNIDVLPYRAKTTIVVKAKLASIDIRVNADSLLKKDILKFIPDQAKYGLIFDATNTKAEGGTRFVYTSWDFDNGLKKSYDGAPKIERIVYTKEGLYNVIFQVKTNKGDIITRAFDIEVRDPIATIDVDREDGFIGDKFNFTAKTSGDPDKLIYSWKIIDLSNNKVLDGEKKGRFFSYVFSKTGNYNVILDVKTTYSNESNTDIKLLPINSRKPIANFNFKFPFPNKPNTIELDATKSFDPDFLDNKDLVFEWYLDGKQIKLDNPTSSNSSFAYYTFDSVGTKKLTLKVIDSSKEFGEVSSNIDINSTLSVDFSASPRVIKRGEKIIFLADSKEAKIFKWDFGDTTRSEGKQNSIMHKYDKSGTYKVNLTVGDDRNISSYSKEVFVGDGSFPLALPNINVIGSYSKPLLEEKVCNGNDAYILNRKKLVKLDLGESIDVNGQLTGLKYDFKIDNRNLENSGNTSFVQYSFDELACYEINFTVTSTIKGTKDKKTIWVKVVNSEPYLGTLNTRSLSEDEENVTLELEAMGVKDDDGVVVSYLWYYYTDEDHTEQAIRRTNVPKTTFVLPKIMGNYYFVVVLTDNDGRSYSSDSKIEKNPFKIVGDNTNANIPILSLKTDKTNVFIGEEVKIIANVQNILEKDLTNKIERYYWDLDGDGFYDDETKSNVLSYKFNKSGTFYSKIKVNYMGYTSTKNISFTVSNKLDADFSYISIGDKFIFMNKSTGNYENFSFDLGEFDKKVFGKNTFEYEYKDGNSDHMVSLNISGSGEAKKKIKKVSKNIKNLIESRKKGLHIFSSPDLKEGNSIFLEKEENVYVYFFSKESENITYVVDLDISLDSDLNGSLSDDKDLETKEEKALEIKLNKSKIQTIRLGYYDLSGILLDTKDIKIIKNYILEENTGTGTTNSVSDEDKKFIELLKESISSFPEQDKKEATNYIKKIQEEWNSDIERTKMIYEFDSYLESLKYDTTKTHDLLMSIFVKGKEDKTSQNILYNAMLGLLTDNIVCEHDASFPNCKAFIKSSLDNIKKEPDLAKRKIIGEKILSIIKGIDISLMSSKNKLDFKASLNNFIYQGKIPENIKNEIFGEDKKTSFSGMTIINILLIIVSSLLGLFFLAAIGFFIYYKFSNKDNSKGLEDFILDKTKLKKDKEDILADLPNTSLEKNKPVDTSIGKDILTNDLNESKIDFKTTVSKNSLAKDIIPTMDLSKDTNNTKIPSWLSGGIKTRDTNKDTNILENSFSIDNTNKKEDKTNKIVLENNNLKDDNKKIEDTSSKIPDWLKGSFNKDISKKEEIKPEVKKDIDLPIVKEKELKIDTKSGLVEESKKEIKPEVKKDIDLPIVKEKELKIDTKSGLVEELKEEIKPEVKKDIDLPIVKEKKLKIDTKSGLVEEPKEEIKPEVKPKIKIKNEITGIEKLGLVDKELFKDINIDNIKNNNNNNNNNNKAKSKDNKGENLINELGTNDKSLFKDIKLNNILDKVNIIEKPKELLGDINKDTAKKDDIPDWLMETFDTNYNSKEKGFEEINTAKSEDWLKESINNTNNLNDKTSLDINSNDFKSKNSSINNIKDASIKTNIQNTSNTTNINIDTNKTDIKIDTINKKDNKISDKELWENGMEVPDWLKSNK